MTATALTVQDGLLGNLSALTEQTADIANGNSFANDGGTILVVSNEEASTAVTVSVAENTDAYGRTVTRTVSVPAGRVGFIGPMKPDVFNDGNGNVNVTYTGSVTAVRVFPVKLRRFQ